MEFNKAAFGAVKNVHGHHQVIASGPLSNNNDKLFVIIQITTFVELGKCSEWFENMEVFILNQQKQIIKAIAIFSDQKEYVNKQKKVGHPNCTLTLTEEDEMINIIDESIMNGILDGFLVNLMENKDDKYKENGDGYDKFELLLSERFDVYDITNLEFKQYGIGSDTISGFLYGYIEKNECRMIVRDFIVIWIDDEDEINRVVQLFIDADPSIEDFKSCLLQNEHEEL